ncbi:MAG: ATP-binding cassette domain-containing protein [Candidatus Lokiarchaeota archaeon]|nr:ATP-binding cassette domain-containing protein [Candidatus Lokiarchaeota archaeon]
MTNYIKNKNRMDVIIDLREIKKDYHISNKKIEVLNNISLKINHGEFIAIVGSSGSGKTTLLNLISGLDSPTRGSIYIKNRDITRFTEDEKIEFRKYTIGFIFQTFNLIPTLTSSENIELALLITEKDKLARSKRIEYLLRIVDLENRKDHKPDELSAGEVQRVAIARAMANDPSIIIADEPTANLDHETAEKIILQMREINELTNKTFIIATHDKTILKKVDRIFSLKNKRITEIK